MFSSSGSSAGAAVATAPRAGMRRGRLEIAITPTAVHAARRWTVDQLTTGESSLSLDLVDDAVLLVSELLTNALAAVGSPEPAKLVVRGISPTLVPVDGRVRLVVERSDWGVRIEVYDSSTAPVPTVRDHGVEDETGRGLCVVAAVAARWGWRPAGIGKVVWCELTS